MADPKVHDGDPEMFWVEAEPRHVKEVIRALGLEDASPARTPGVAAKGETRVDDNEGTVRSRRG